MDKSIIVELGHGELKELGVDLLGDRLAILKCAKVFHKLKNTINCYYQIKNDKPKKPRAKRRPEKVKKITKEKEIEEKEDGDDEISRVLSSVKSKTKECFSYERHTPLYWEVLLRII